jgi:hypothetical protein
MKTSPSSLLKLSGLLLGTILILPALGEPEAKKVDFDREVRPILSENCFKCHGFDEKARKARLRLDAPEGITQKLPSGHVAVVPGKPDQSALIQRISAHSMPPPDSGKKLTAAQIDTLKRWVAEGGKYEQHWAFVPPKRPTEPAVKLKSWPANPIDRFILAQLEKEGLKPSPAADRRTLIRRVTFDLTGLPPTPAEVQAFLNDTKPGAYERVVDRLLASTHYGERMALSWLDLARYADTHGYHIDSHRDMWRWRDWVIEAYNKNLPFDQFVTWQVAGDLLPNATLEQKIATGFNRNHPINFEGGAIPEEYAAAYIFDRIDTTSTAFLGLTMRCSQCHDHKYDPVTQKEFYQFYAFFNNVPEQGLDGQKGNAAPFIKAPLPGQMEELASYKAKMSDMEKAMKAREAEAAPALAAWEKRTAASLAGSSVNDGLTGYYDFEEGSGSQAKDAAGKQTAGTLQGKAVWAKGQVGGAIKLDGTAYVDLGPGIKFERTDKFSYGAWVYPTSNEALTVLSKMDDAAKNRGWDMYLGDRRVFIHLISEWEGNAIRVNTKSQIDLNKWTHLFATYDGSGKAGGVRVYVNGKLAEVDVTHDKLTGSIVTDKPALIGRRTPNAPFKGMIDEARIYGRELSAAEVEQLVSLDMVRPILSVEAEKRTAEQKQQIAKFYLEHEDEPYKKLAADYSGWTKKHDDLDNAIPTTMVMQEMEKPRDTFILLRGQYDKHGEKVSPGAPSVLPPLPKDVPANRLALAKWLVDPNHPLTARVAVNRYWQMYFGTGLVKTAENFGTQGEAPSHPELLDWLATEFIRTGWDIKKMQRLIVTSNTYKQSSRVTDALLEKDPENRLLARGPRFRLQAEFVRDEVLAVSGLLVPKIGGPSVKPYQPPGLWEEISFKGEFSAQYYVQDHGENLYRRSMYTFWKRTCPPPMLQSFDAPEREFCIVRRSTTNTPLQALAVMNETGFVEASRKFAERIVKEGGSAPQERIKYAYNMVLCRDPKSEEAQVLLGVYNRQLAAFRKDVTSAVKYLSVGESKRDETLDAAEVAAWSCVANVIFNMDEAMTKG